MFTSKHPKELSRHQYHEIVVTLKTFDASRQTPNMYTKPKIYQILQANKLQLNVLLNYNYLHTIFYREIQREKVEN